MASTLEAPGDETKLNQLYEIIQCKRTSVCLSLDVSSFEYGKYVLDICGPYICMVKLHPELLYDWCSNPMRHSATLKELASTYNFMIMYDAKLTDVPAICYKQVCNPNYLAHTWADFITVMPTNYNAICTYLASMDITRNITPLLVTEMNTMSPLFDSNEYKLYITSLLESGTVSAVISQRSYLQSIRQHNILSMTPGVIIKPADSNSVSVACNTIQQPHAIQQQYYRSIYDAIYKDGNLIVIIGGSIINVEHMGDILQNIQSAAKQSYDALSQI